MNFKSYFEKAMPYEEYESILGENLPMHRLHYDKCKTPDEWVEKIKAVKPLKLLVLSEPWCGDSLAIFPVLKKMADINGSWEVKVLLRDQNLDLIDQFLTRGGRAVPLFFFLADDYSLIFKWGPRPNAAQQIFEDHRQLIEQGKIEKKDVILKIRNFYSRNRGEAIINELLPLLK